MIPTYIFENSDYSTAGIVKITTISKNDTVMGGIYKNNNIDTSRSQPSLLLALIDTPKLYRIKKIIQLENNIITLDDAIDVESTDSNNKNNSAPLFSKGGGVENAYYQIVFREDGVNNSIYINQMGLGKIVIAIFTYLAGKRYSRHYSRCRALCRILVELYVEL